MLNSRNNGDLLKGLQTIDGRVYYFDEDGRMLKGWHDINGNKYYFMRSGERANNIQVIDNKVIVFRPDGTMVSNEAYNWYGQILNVNADGSITGSTAEAIKKAESVLNYIGYDLKTAFNWSAGLTYYRMQNYGIKPGNGDVHSAWYANYGFDNGRGNCYVMASTFVYMARLLNYDAYFIEGGVQNPGFVAPHGWCEIIMDGKLYVIDPNFTNEGYGNGYMIWYGKKGTWRYTKYGRIA